MKLDAVPVVNTLPEHKETFGAEEKAALPVSAKGMS